MTVHTFARTSPNPPLVHCDSCPVRQAAICGFVESPADAGFSRRAQPSHFSPDQVILPQDEAINRVGIIVEGQVKVVRRTADGEEVILRILGPGDVVGRAFEARLPAGFEAATAARICLMPRSDFEAALARDPGLQRGYLMAVLGELDRERLWAATMRGRSATERLAAWLDGVARRPARRDAPGRPQARAVVEIELRRRDVAALLDMTPETLSRALHQIADGRVVRLLSPNRIEVTDPEGLSSMAGRALAEAS